MAAGEIAARAAELIEGEPLGRAADFGGPQVLSSRQVIGIWRDRFGRPRAVAGLGRLPGSTYRAFAQGHNTAPGQADGVCTWAEFVAGI